MTARRQHSDVLLAGLILVGATMWLFAQAHAIWGHMDLAARLAMWLFSGFVAAQIARRLLPELDLGEMAIAAIVAMTIVVGTFSQRQGQRLEIEILIPIASATTGAIAGAFTSRRRSAEAHAIWRVLGAGFASFGAALLAVGLTVLVTTSDAYAALAMCGGALIGSFAIARFSEANSGHCAVGLGVVLAGALVLANDDFNRIAVTLIGFGLGAVIGVIGGAIGARIRERRKPASTLPEAQVRDG